ncbi:MAG: hypothetical protein AB8G16_08530 [Gammaproteobacteria bacterium]
MRRLILIALFLSLLGGLALTAQHFEFGAASSPMAESPVAAPAAPLRAPSGFALKMSPRLSKLPSNAAAKPRATPDTAPAPFWQQINLPLLGLLLGASLLGMAFMRAWRGQPAETVALVEPQREERSAPVFERDEAVDQVNANAMRALRERLAAVEDDLHTTEAARDELALQLSSVETSLGEAQEKAVALQATIAQRDNDIAQANAQLISRGEEVAHRDARIAEMVQALADTDQNSKASAEQIAALDEEGIEQRVITVAFEKALLDADVQLAQTAADLSAQRDANAELTTQLHDADTQFQTHRTDAEARAETMAQNAERQRADLESQSRKMIDTLTGERDTLETSLREAREALDERDATLEHLRQDLQLHVDQVASLGEVRDRMAAWQPTVDTLQADLRRKDGEATDLRGELDDTTQQLIAARTLAEQVAPLEQKLEEQSALTRILKDAADSMRLYKNAADSRGFQISKLQGELKAQTLQTQESQGANESAREDIADLRRELGERDQSLSGTELVAQERAEKITQLEATLEQESGALAHLRDQLNDQQTQRAELETEFGELEALALDMGSTLEAPIEPVADAVAVDLETLHRNAKHSVQRVRERLEIVQDLERALELDLEDSNACLRMTESESIRVNDALNALLPKLKAANSERDDAQAHAAELQQQAARIDEALHDRTQLEGRCSQLQAQLDDWIARENEIVARVDALAQERALLADNLAATRSAHDEAAARARRENVRRVSLRHSIEQRETHIARLNSELESEQTQSASTQEELTARNAELVDAQSQLATAQQELDARDTQWRDVETHLETRLASHEEALTKSRAEYVAKATEIDQIILSARKEREALAGQLHEAQQKVGGLNEALQREEQGHGQREEELATANLALRDALKSVRHQTDEQIQRLRSDLERGEQTARELTQKLETSARTQATYANAVAKLKTELAKSQAQIQALNEAANAPKPAPKIADKPVRVPVLNRPVNAPPVLTRAVSRNDDDNKS